ncbi:winged helix-turn-helix transcriptional regulator [Kitasatospora camelliae]|uniref:Helix-turn-helix domain-containing protein n=1 Tax=Kitasatospora camelliae TaxID=3156397 RepID=A0AAU8JU88_9ACTN
MDTHVRDKGSGLATTDNSGRAPATEPAAGAPDCRARDLLDRLGSKWSVPIILTLASGTLRFTELKDGVRGITPKVLTANLRELERDGLVSRQVFAEVPPRAEYTLTPLGETLIETYRVVQGWTERHLEEVIRCREAYDREHGRS